MDITDNKDVQEDQSLINQYWLASLNESIKRFSATSSAYALKPLGALYYLILIQFKAILVKMGGSSYSKIQQNHGAPGIQKLLQIYSKMDLSNQFEQDLKNGGFIGIRKNHDHELILKVKKELREHFENKKDFVQKNYPGELQKASTINHVYTEQLLGFTQQDKKLNDILIALKTKYDHAISETHSEIAKSKSQIKSGLNEFDSLNYQGKEKTLKDCYQKNKMTKSQINKTEEQVFYWRKKFLKITDENDLNDQLIRSKKIISDHAHSLTSNSTCRNVCCKYTPCCCSCCC